MKEVTEKLVVDGVKLLPMPSKQLLEATRQDCRRPRVSLNPSYTCFREN